MNIQYQGKREALDVLRWAIAAFHPRIAVACSLQHTVLIDMAVRIQPQTRVFSIDTGRLNEDSYQFAWEIERRFKIKIEWYFPQTEPVEEMLRRGGVYSFRESQEARRQCCAVRKMEPLCRALSGLDAWVSGIRRDQTTNRKNTSIVEPDPGHGNILKINPLADWTHKNILQYTREHNLPRNPLLEKGYTSIGCACCTRATGRLDDSRSGRWWWEQADSKECGIHVRDWQI